MREKKKKKKKKNKNAQRRHGFKRRRGSKHTLNEAEVRYLPLEKTILAVVHAIRKLPYYFQAHTMVVLT